PRHITPKEIANLRWQDIATTLPDSPLTPNRGLHTGVHFFVPEDAQHHQQVKRRITQGPPVQTPLTVLR
ncbi:unnamed protein product, partial [Ectocarpus sp. 4 AP-2014]